MTKQQKTYLSLGVLIIAVAAIILAAKAGKHAAPAAPADDRAGDPAQAVSAVPSAPADTATAKVFANAGYSFAVPSGWNAVVNKYVATTALFGPNTKATESQGGVEIYAKQASLEQFMKEQQASLGISFTDVRDITVNGLSGKTMYMKGQVPATDAYVTHVFKDGTVYTIYFRPANENELAMYRELVQSFAVTAAK